MRYSLISTMTRPVFAALERTTTTALWGCGRGVLGASAVDAAADDDSVEKRAVQWPRDRSWNGGIGKKKTTKKRTNNLGSAKT